MNLSPSIKSIHSLLFDPRTWHPVFPKPGIPFVQVFLKKLENISARKVYEKLDFKINGETEDKKQLKMKFIL